MKIDIFTHGMHPRYKQAFYKYTDKSTAEKAAHVRHPILTDCAARLGKLEPHEDLFQVLSAIIPSLDESVDVKKAAELVSMGETINGIEKMDLSDVMKRKNHEENAQTFLHL